MTGSGRKGAAAAILVAILAVTGCRTVPRAPAGRAARSPLVLLVLDRARERAGRPWRPEERVDDLLDQAVLARTGAEFPLEGWAALARDGRVTVVAVPGPGGPVARAVVRRFRLALGEDSAVTVIDPGAPGAPPAAWVLVFAPRIARDGTVRGDGAEVARRLAEAGWPAPSLVLADLLRPPVGGTAWEAREVLVGTSPEAVAEVAAWQLRGRLTGSLPPPAGAPRARLEVLPVAD